MFAITKRAGVMTAAAAGLYATNFRLQSSMAQGSNDKLDEILKVIQQKTLHTNTSAANCQTSNEGSESN